jgi:hypothetical protein
MGKNPTFNVKNRKVLLSWKIHHNQESLSMKLISGSLSAKFHPLKIIGQEFTIKNY